MSDILNSWATTLTAMIAIAGGLSVVFHKWVRPAYKQIKRVTEAADRLIPFAEAQLRPNGGSSLADKIDRIAVNHAAAEEHWTKLEAKQLSIEEKLEKHTAVEEEHHREVSARLGAIEEKQ